MEAEIRKIYSPFNRDLYFKGGNYKMTIEIYLEELCRTCEEIEELRRFPNNFRAGEEELKKIKYVEKMIEEVKEWLDA